MLFDRAASSSLEAGSPAENETMAETLFASESVTEGHPDKVCDYIADSILDAYLDLDREEDALGRSRVAVEASCKTNLLVLAGEITSGRTLDHVAIVRQAIREIGYVDPDEPFHADGVFVIEALTPQASEIAQGVNREAGELGAGDQGIMFGYASDSTPELMPLSILLAHRLTAGLARDRKEGRVDWLRPDGKSQVTVAYRDGTPRRVTQLLVSTQHAPDVAQSTIHEYVHETLGPAALGDWWSDEIEILVNPTGSFAKGGPSVDSGLTGRKIIVDTYGGIARHGGGSFSGKDPTKVDRSGHYWCRYLARRLVREGLARRAEVRVGYAIGRSEPMFVDVETFRTGDPAAASAFVGEFGFSPSAMIRDLRLWTDVRYRDTTNYGHFGRPGFPWEED